MRVSLIVAMSDNRVIGRDGGLPWRLPADLRHFQRVTMGHHLIMGRRTHESIGRPLPGRTSIVLTRQEGYAGGGALIAHDLDEAIQLAGGDDEVFVIGGAEIYRWALPRVDRMYLTEVHAHIEGDVYFPDFDQQDWTPVEERHHVGEDTCAYDYTFRILDRRVYRDPPCSAAQPQPSDAAK